MEIRDYTNIRQLVLDTWKYDSCEYSDLSKRDGFCEHIIPVLMIPLRISMALVNNIMTARERVNRREAA